MKTVLWILAFVSATAFANSDSDLAKAKAWIKNTLGSQTSVIFPGQTTDGQSCSLYVTRSGVMVAMSESKDSDDWVPIDSDKAKVIYDPSTVWFEQSFASGRHVLIVAIQTNEDGKPLRAVAHGFKNIISCNLK